MSTIHQARRLFLGSTVVFALSLLAPVAVTAEDAVAVMAPVAGPLVVGTVEDVRATRALAAERALLSGDIGSLQEEALVAIVAQEATPAAGAIVPELLGHGLPNAAPGFDLSLYRVTFAAGAVLPPHTHPGASVVYVESGTLGFTSLEGEAWLMRAGTTATPEAQGELLAHDTEVTLEAGDALFFPDEHGDSAFNAGDGPLVLWLANLHTAGEPLLTLMDMATPMP